LEQLKGEFALSDKKATLIINNDFFTYNLCKKTKLAII